jgi:hypothetical protein
MHCANMCQTHALCTQVPECMHCTNKCRMHELHKEEAASRSASQLMQGMQCAAPATILRWHKILIADSAQ